jgi:hypothetical protein
LSKRLISWNLLLKPTIASNSYGFIYSINA